MGNPFASNMERLVLGILRDHPAGMYGLEMIGASDGSLKRGTIYVLLGRMEDKGYVKSKVDKQASHPGLPRPRYTLTALGQRALLATEAAYDAAEAQGWSTARA
jgi:DNA-binding PadR family transcriptional regulator